MHYISRFFTYLGILCILLGAFLTYQHFNPALLSFTDFEKPQKVVIQNSASPLYLSIPSVHIGLPIYAAHIINNQWETTTLGVSYLIDSPIPGQRGNSILYGHNWQVLLGNLVYVKPGEKVNVLFSDHSSKQFNIIYTTIVNPTDVSILTQSRDTRITLYTCTGFLDSKRFVAVATLE